MTIPTKVKLPNVGDSLTLAVTACALAPVGKFPGIEFTGLRVGGAAFVCVEVPTGAAARQLDRLGLSQAQCVGQTLRIYREHNATAPDKPYWSIVRMDRGDERAADAAEADPAPDDETPDAPLRTHTTPAATPAFDPLTTDEPPHPADRAPAEQAAPRAAGDLRDDLDRARYYEITVDTLAHLVPLYREAGVVVDGATVAAIIATRWIQASRWR